MPLTKKFIQEHEKKVDKIINQVRKDYLKYEKMSIDELGKLQFKFIEDKLYNTETLEALRIVLARKEGVKYSRDWIDGKKLEIYPDGRMVKNY